jgi:glycosyltransferase involved in cell wall biosynthesis
VHYQARAFMQKNEGVLVLCPHDYLEGRALDYPVSRVYGSLVRKKKPRTSIGRMADLLRRTGIFLHAHWRLAWEVLKRRPDAVLFDSYREYLSPLWVWPHVALVKACGVTYIANLHDPVRDFVVGPLWWHNLSVRLAYWPVRVSVVHQRLDDSSIIPPHVAVVEAPVGVYDLQESVIDPMEVRRMWGIPREAVVFLSFGFIRDNKNLDLLIRALAEVPDAFLVVMGSAQSSINKPLKFYQDLAGSLGVANRVIFREEFVPDEALAGYFAAADVIAITYNSQFRSQSGVLNIAARAKRPVLASAGESPLKTAVVRFRLGEFVEPDNPATVAAGMSRLCRSIQGKEVLHAPDWSGYEKYASWGSNVEIIKNATLYVSGTAIRGKSCGRTSALAN